MWRIALLLKGNKQKKQKGCPRGAVPSNRPQWRNDIQSRITLARNGRFPESLLLLGEIRWDVEKKMCVAHLIHRAITYLTQRRNCPSWSGGAIPRLNQVIASLREKDARFRNILFGTAATFVSFRAGPRRRTVRRSPNPFRG